MAHSSNAAAQLLAPLVSLKGVGEHLSAKLARLDLYTIEDLLYQLPVRYEDRRHLLSIAQLRPGESAPFRAQILSAAEVKTGGRRSRTVFEVLVGDDSGQIVLKWFHYRRAWMERSYRPGREILAFGEVRMFGTQREILHPEVEFDPAAQQGAAILPVYPLTEGISQKRMRSIIQAAAIDYSSFLHSDISVSLRDKRNLIEVGKAVLYIHNPPLDADIQALQERTTTAHRSLIYADFFYMQLGLALRQRRQHQLNGRAFTVSHCYTKPLIQQLPFELTPAQIRVLGEIKRDMIATAPMHRLLQGDVGSGKTIVALLSALIAVENGAQVGVVAPTEILAEQHYRFFATWLAQLNLCAALLTGSTPTRARSEMLTRLKSGEIHIIVGTHALLQDDVVFNDLGLGVIDEQHRFGVQQRNVLRHKGDNPDILVMTATPIPRTLSMTLYGDMQISIIDQLPQGRIPIVTRVLAEAKREGLYSFVKEQAQAGLQSYFIFPLVEESETLELKAAEDAFTHLQEKLGAGCRVGLLHGRMRSGDKEEVMLRFKQGELDVLVATTVIEVGIDVPNATVMVIEHAERFGLAQLHQLRGRVGRGTEKSYCFLFHSPTCSAQGLERLHVLERYRDGFNIAEADLNMRGPGEYLGTQQSGLPEFRVADLLADRQILEHARADAFNWIAHHHLSEPESVAMLQTMERRWGKKLELAGAG
ncbi:MAG: ATP-dependent DNA helicase RecG [Desulfuromonadaceae bacterium]|nr:ATP-dependent DNA helicase RecG [Desulfuromonadaceae bacterium]